MQASKQVREEKNLLSDHFGCWIRIRIKVKSWFRIRIKLKAEA
jgi:hypothetical protein